MLSSTNLFKASHIMGDGEKTVIDTDIVKIEVEAPIAFTEEESELNTAKDEGRKIVARAEQIRQEKVSEAETEAENIKNAAYQEGLQLGKDNGHLEGYQQGLQEGLAQAEKENIQAKANITVMLQQAIEEAQAYHIDKKAEIIELASHMAEKIVHQQVDASDKGIMMIAKPYFYQLDKDEEFVTITVHPSQRDFIEENISVIENASPHTRFIVFVDPNVEPYGMIIESTKAVIDLQVKKQLDAMLQEFEETERTIND